MILKESIQNLYKAFQKYDLNGKISKCNCGCIPESEELKIYAHPLRELSSNDLGFYLYKAMTTWGTIEDFKHFLPRIIELYSVELRACPIGIDTIYDKLLYSDWRRWPENEIKAITKVVMNIWDEMVNWKDSEIGVSDLDSFAKFSPLGLLMDKWEVTNNAIALKNFILFFYYHGNDLMMNNNLVKNLETEGREKISQVTLEPDFISELENEYFKSEKIDLEYAEKVSIIIQMIEKEIKLKKSEGGSK